MIVITAGSRICAKDLFKYKCIKVVIDDSSDHSTLFSAYDWRFVLLISMDGFLYGPIKHRAHSKSQVTCKSLCDLTLIKIFHCTVKW